MRGLGRTPRSRVSLQALRAPTKRGGQLNQRQYYNLESQFIWRRLDGATTIRTAMTHFFRYEMRSVFETVANLGPLTCPSAGSAATLPWVARAQPRPPALPSRP